MTKKATVIFISLLIFTSLFLFGAVAWSAGTTADINELARPIATQAGYDVSTTNQYTLSVMVGGIVKALLTMAGTIFLIIVFWSGFLWMTASGNEDQVSNAQSKLKMAVIGLVIVIASYSITAIVLFATTSPKSQQVGDVSQKITSDDLDAAKDKLDLQNILNGNIKLD